MELTYERLIQFDLIDEFEKSLLESKNINAFSEFLTTTNEINSTDQFIKDSPSFPGSTDKIVRGELISAIGSTLSIEGTNMNPDEIEESFKKADLEEELKRNEQEAENSRKVYKFILELVENTGEQIIYDERIIKQIHKYFTENMNYLSNVPGEYRGDFPVSFGTPRRKGLCKTRADIELAMKNFVNWLNKEKSGFMSSNTIIKAILAHYYLTEIHPFGDGNGRTARALEAFILYLNGVNTYCFWSLTNFWSINRNDYITHLGNIRNTSNPWDFLIWGMKGYLEELKRIKGLVLKKVKQLMLMDYTKYLFSNKKNEDIKINERIVHIISILVHENKLPMSKFLAQPAIKALYNNVSNMTTSRDFKKMTDLRLIKSTDIDGKKYIEANFKLLDFLEYGV
jgi:Fic family protein